MNRRWTPQLLETFAEEARRSIEREEGGKAYEALRRITYGVADIAEQFCNILQSMVPNGSEYSFAFGLAAFLLFKPLNRRLHEEEKMAAQVTRISELLPKMHYLKHALKTPTIELAVSGLCGEIVRFLWEVVKYSKHSRMRKFVTHIIPRTSSVEEYVESIERHVDMIRELEATASLAIQLDLLERQTTESKLVVRMYQSMQANTARINTMMDSFSAALARQRRFEAVIYSQKLRHALLPRPPDREAGSRYIKHERERLVTVERWETHSNEIDFQQWLKGNRQPLLWICGRHRQSRISWVTPFSVDLNNTLVLEGSVMIASAFYDDGSERYWTSAMIVKNIIYQMLEQYPELAVDLVDILTPWRFEDAGDSPNLYLEILDDMLSKMSILPGWQAREFFLLIDRIDLCYDTKDFSVENDFYPALQRLNQRHMQLHLILTSDEDPEEVDSINTGEDNLTVICVDTCEGGRMSLREY
ncbi:hypothetical protein MMYC01_206993 [Madurella mycetomatis]|uniref:Uncharacterized protein n=1 Tax=Madurella mycetomatis TaxID=100816 RepID=A0A175W3T4_9PEZI|nr:hypothetical protein MMYC01_206993 [Madurella mycetomatis]